MRRLGLIIPVLLSAGLSVSALVLHRASAQNAPPTIKKAADKKADAPAKTGEKASSKDVGKQWAELLARREKIEKGLEELEAKFEAADNTGKEKIADQLQKLRTEFQTEVGPVMAKIAPVIFEKDPSDAIAAQFAIGAAVEKQKYAVVVGILNKLIKAGTAKPNMIEYILQVLLEENRFTDVTAVADKLIEAKDVKPHLLFIDSMAHFFSNDFEKARDLAKRNAEADPASARGSEGFIKTCDEYAGFWKKEQAIRAKEAKADDLPRVLLKTNKGDIVLELFENEAPNTVANFISLVEARKYDGTKFHRVIPKFMARGGDPNTLDDDPGTDGGGGPGYTIACECYSEKARKHFQGSVSMAHAGRDSGGSQFFLTCIPTAHLNWAPDKKKDNHTVFGRIVEGLDVVLALRQADPDLDREADVIESAKVIRKRDHKYAPEKNDGGKNTGGKKAPAKKTDDDE